MDVKPKNAMRAEGGRIVLLDFGFARPTEERAGAEGSPIGGTPPFMSPEHFEGRTDIGPRSDIYSLGVLLYWLMAGRYPYEHEDFADLAAKVLAGSITPLVDHRPDAPAGLVEILERAMARQEHDRFTSAGEFEEALRRFVGGQERVREEPNASYSFARRGLLSASAVLVLFAGAWWLSGSLSGKSFRLEYSFYKGSGEEAIPLTEQGSVRVGDHLFLRARSGDAFYLYVFNQDERGNWFRLLPAGESPAHALNEQNVWHRFPPGEWIVNSAGDTEHLYVIAAPHRVAFADELAEIIPPTGKHEGSLTRGQRERLRGIGGETTNDVVEKEVFDLQTVFAAFQENLDGSSSIHATHWQFRNEGGPSD